MPEYARVCQSMPNICPIYTQDNPRYAQDMAAICDLPIEMRLEILEKLSLHELVVNASRTCHQWRDDIAQHILAPKILALAKVNEKFKMDIKEKGWTEEANNTTELIMSLFNKYDHFTSKFFSARLLFALFNNGFLLI